MSTTRPIPPVCLVERSEFEGVEHPSFLAAHPGGNVLYAVSETASSDGGGLVALRVDPVDGSLTVIDRVSSHGDAPCYVSVDADGRYLYVANYLSGTIAVYALAPDGRFGELVATHQHSGSGPSARQQGPHAHCIVPGPVGDSVYAVDLGTDRVSHYVHDRQHDGDAFVLDDQLVLDAGSGPRHLAFHPEQPVGFLVCELDSTIVTLGVDPTDGRLTRLRSSSTLPDDFVGESIAAEVRVHPNGRHVYVSNRGHDSIAVFGFTGPDEPLEPLGHVPQWRSDTEELRRAPVGSRAAGCQPGQQHGRSVRDRLHRRGCRGNSTSATTCREPVCLTFLEVAR